MKNNIFIIPLCALLDLFIIFKQRKKTSSEDAKRKNEERKKIEGKKFNFVKVDKCAESIRGQRE